MPDWIGQQHVQTCSILSWSQRKTSQAHESRESAPATCPASSTLKHALVFEETCFYFGASSGLLVQQSLKELLTQPHRRPGADDDEAGTTQRGEEGA